MASPDLTAEMSERQFSEHEEVDMEKSAEDVMICQLMAKLIFNRLL
jgi:hypothetical protein